MMIPVVILCGGTGTRLKEQTEFIPKPMIQIGGKPVIWHIMKIYATQGFNTFVLALGYKQEIFKKYFAHFEAINSDIIFARGMIWGMQQPSADWIVTLADTGLNTFKGGRLKRIEKYIQGDTFMMTYGDAVADIDINALLSFHRSHGKIATVSGIHPAPRFGEIHNEGGHVISFSEKPDGECLSNGGFFVFNREIFDYLTEDERCDLETGPLERIAAEGEMMVYEHKGYWGCMDNLREMGELQELWDSGKAPWKTW